MRSQVARSLIVYDAAHITDLNARQAIDLKHVQ